MLLRSLPCWLAVLLVAPFAISQKQAIAVVSVPGVEAYDQTTQALRQQFPDLQLLDARDEVRLRDRLSDPALALIVAVGSDAALAIDRVAPAQLPVIRTDLLQFDVEQRAPLKRPGASISVDIPPAILFAKLKSVFPGKTRLGMIRGPMQTDGYRKAAEQAARQYGFTLEILDCLEARKLVSSFLQFRTRVDFVWCPPNPQLYNSATLKPLLIASLTNRLPIIGFSEQFAQAGALFTEGAHFRDVGNLTAELAARVLQGEAISGNQEARKFRFVYNQRIARLLGIRAAVDTQPGDEWSVIQ